jgi:hypothetical protein
MGKPTMADIPIYKILAQHQQQVDDEEAAASH